MSRRRSGSTIVTIGTIHAFIDLCRAVECAPISEGSCSLIVDHSNDNCHSESSGLCHKTLRQGKDSNGCRSDLNRYRFTDLFLLYSVMKPLFTDLASPEARQLSRVRVCILSGVLHRSSDTPFSSRVRHLISAKPRGVNN